MFIKPRNIIATVLIGLVVAGFSTLGYRFTQEGGDLKTLFSANITGISSDSFDPLASGLACFPEGSGLLEVTGASGSYDWKVTPAHDVLSDAAGGLRFTELTNVGGQVKFTPPETGEVAATYFVEAVEAGTEFGLGGGETFEVQMGPSCITSIEFLNPAGAVLPEDGQVKVSSVQATLSNGKKVTYDGSEMAKFGINMVADPADAVTITGNTILVPFDHPTVNVNLELSGKVLEPTVFDKSNLVQKAPNESPIYGLESDEVDPDSVAVFDNSGGQAGDLLVEGTDYQFVDMEHDDNSDTNDYLIWLLQPAPENLFVSYWHYDSDKVLSSENPLVITGAQCELLSANLYQGLGQGFLSDAPGVTPSAGSVSDPFVFAGTEPIESILLSNPIAQGNTFGSAVFEYVYSFNTQLAKKAVLVNKAGSNYEIAVRDEGVDDPAGTAANFAFAVNTIAGSTSPFVAYINPADNTEVLLYSLEVGAHTNDYLCSVNGEAFGADAHCFDGGITGTDADGDDLAELDPPLPLNPVMHQGETRVVYSKGGISNLSWSSSDSSIFSVAPLSEASAQNQQLTNDHVIFAQSIDSADFTIPASGSPILTSSDCVYEALGAEGASVDVLQSCNVSLVAPISVNLPPTGYPITIVPPAGNPVQGSIQGDNLAGTLMANSVVPVTGGILVANGTFTGSVTGDAVGTVVANVTLQLAIDNYANPDQLNEKWSVTSISGQLSKGQLIPVNQTVNDEIAVTNFAILSAKKPGQATLFVTDKLGCAAPLEIEVLGQQLFVEFEDPAQSDFVEVGDSFQLRAWTGFPGALEGDNEVTNVANWEVDESDSEVVQISQTGLVTALKPGTAKVYAKYNTGTVETGEIVSEGSLLIHVRQLDGLTISLDAESIAKLPVEVQKEAYKSVVLAVNELDAAGRSITLEGQTIALSLPNPTVPYSTELDQIEGIVHGLLNDESDGLIADLQSVPGVAVAPHPEFSGVLILEAVGDNESLDITTTASAEELTFIANITSAIDLSTTDTYQLLLVGDYDSGRTQLLSPLDVKWLNTPVNTLDDSALPTGLVKRGEGSGSSTLIAQVENEDGTIISSNSLTFEIEEGPVIEFVNVIGAADIVKGDSLELMAKIKDIDGLEDLQDITVSLVKSTADSYAAILEDPSATWFTTNPFLEAVEVSDSVEEGSEEVAIDDDFTLFKNFTFPIEIPVDANLFDGPYKLVIVVTDKTNREASYVLPIFIGKVATGDINADGKINMIDVIMAFQISNGKLDPTAQQLTAGNMDGFGKINMIDVILLFQKVVSG